MKKSEFKVQFCVSSITHINMWKPVILCLRKHSLRLSINVLSFDRYYGQSPKHLFNRMEIDNFTILERRWTKASYWKMGGLSKLLMLIEALLRTKFFLKNHLPDVVVLGNDIGILENAMITIARSLRIPTILVQDGILRSKNRLPSISEMRLKGIFYNLLGLSANRIYGFSKVTAFAVMGKYTYDLLELQGRNMQNVFMVGQPRFDEYVNAFQNVPSYGDQAAFRKKLGFPSDGKIIGFFSQPLITYRLMEPGKWDRIINSILLSLGRLKPEYYALFKLHPSEHTSEIEERYADQLQNLGDHVKLNSNLDLVEILQGVDLVIVYSSTVTLEAVLLGKPVIIFNPYEFTDDYQFVEMGVALHASTEDELVKCIKLMSDNPQMTETMMAARHQAIAYHIGQFDGLASSRVSELILKFYAPLIN